MPVEWLLDFDEIEAVAASLDLREPNRFAVQQLATLLSLRQPDKRAPVEIVADVATGVGKTWIMAGAMEYLHRTSHVNAFCIIAPNRTIRDKTVRQFTPGDPQFIDGLTFQPLVVTADTFASGEVREAVNDPQTVVVFILTVQSLLGEGDKQDKQAHRRTHTYNEDLGQDLYSLLQSVDGLVVFADEHHAYSGEKFSATLRDIGAPVIVGLTGTPLDADRPNVFFQYGLAHALNDRYVKAPVLVARRDDLAADESAKLSDGLTLLEQKQQAIDAYVQGAGAKPVKAVMLVACPDIATADEIADLLSDPRMHGGRYGGEVCLVIHSGSDDAARERLYTVDDPDSPVRIVINVAMLKEGWDSKSVYVLVSLRASASEILTAQTLGRGLRLPWGAWVDGYEMLNTLDIVAHERYEELLAKSQVLTSRLLHSDTWQQQTAPAIAQHGTDEENLARLEAKGRVIGKPTPPRRNPPAPRTPAPHRSGAQQPSGTARDRAHPPADTRPTQGPQQPAALPVETVGERVRHNRQEVEDLSRFMLSDNHRNDSCPNLPIVRAHPRAKISRLTQATDYKSVRAVAARVPRTAADAFNRRVAEVTLTDEGQQAFIAFTGTSTVVITPDDQPALFEQATRDYLYARLKDAGLSTARDNLGDEDTAAFFLVDEFIEGVGTDNLGALARLRERSAEMLINEVRRQITRANAGATQWVHDISWQKPNKRRTREITKPYTDGYGIPEGNQTGYTDWAKSAFPENTFDSSPEYRLAVLADNDPATNVWLRLLRGDMPILWRNSTSHYNPDFLIIVNNPDGTETAYVVEVKGDDQAETDTVLGKAEAARSWADHVTEDDPNGRTWRYILVTQTQVEAASDLRRLLTIGETNAASANPA